MIINLYVGDRDGRSTKAAYPNLSAAAIADFQEQAKKDINNLLRVRLKEPGMTIRYGGQDIVDLKTVDWVDITDSEQRNFRLAVDRSSHLLDRAVVSTPDETMNSRNVETNIFTNFQLMDGVRTAMQITTDRNGRRSSQVFFTHLQVQLQPSRRSVHQGLTRQALLRSRQQEIQRREEERKRRELTNSRAAIRLEWIWRSEDLLWD